MNRGQCSYQHVAGLVLHVLPASHVTLWSLLPSSLPGQSFVDALLTHMCVSVYTLTYAGVYACGRILEQICLSERWNMSSRLKARTHAHSVHACTIMVHFRAQNCKQCKPEYMHSSSTGASELYHFCCSRSNG